MATTNFIKKIFDKNITEEVHNAFTRYSLGEFVKEPFTVKLKKDITVQGGFEFLNFFQKFVAENVKGDVTVSGTIETVRDLSATLQKLGVDFENARRFGKPGSKFVLSSQKLNKATFQKLILELFSEYLLFNVSFDGGELKVKKQTTPKLGSPTEKFVTLKLPKDWLAVLKQDYLFDVDSKDFSELTVDQTYYVEDIDVDEKLLGKDADAARKKALRKGEISRKVTVDGKVVKEYKFKFTV